MKTQFTEASRLIINNWDIVKAIHESESALAAEFRDFLFSIESDLSQYPWWGNQWAFVRLKDSQVYIARREWQRDQDYVLGIGVENFTPESLFRADSYAQMYVYAWGSPQIAEPLRRYLADRDDFVGELSTKSGTRYVATAALRKCLPEEIDSFEAVVGKPILDFMDYYGSLHEPFTQIMGRTDQSHVSEG